MRLPPAVRISTVLSHVFQVLAGRSSRIFERGTPTGFVGSASMSTPPVEGHSISPKIKNLKFLPRRSWLRALSTSAILFIVELPLFLAPFGEGAFRFSIFSALTPPYLYSNRLLTRGLPA